MGVTNPLRSHGYECVAGRIQPLLAVLPPTSDATDFIENARRLRYSTDPLVRESVYINADLTKAETLAAYQCRCRRREMTATRRNNPNNTNSAIDGTTGVVTSISISTALLHRQVTLPGLQSELVNCSSSSSRHPRKKPVIISLLRCQHSTLLYPHSFLRQIHHDWLTWPLLHTIILVMLCHLPALLRLLVMMLTMFSLVVFFSMHVVYVTTSVNTVKKHKGCTLVLQRCNSHCTQVFSM